eukprot:jgi/Ulvmu1/11038/UM007_0219.1
MIGTSNLTAIYTHTTSCCSAMAKPVTLPSSGASCSREAALIYFPGALIEPESYIPLLRAIQSRLEQAGVALHAVAQSPDIPTASLGPGAEGQKELSSHMLETALGTLRTSCGFEGTPDKLIFAGHSFGSYLATAAAFSDPSFADGVGGLTPIKQPRCRALLSHGTCTPPDHVSFQNLQAVPVAEILGERDGLIRLCNVVRAQSDTDLCVPTPADRARIAPVAILPNVNHASFSNGSTNPYAAARDLPATAPLAATTAAIADASAQFIIATDPGANAAAARAAVSFFERSTRSAREDFFDVYREALARDTRGDTCREAQELVLGMKSCMGPPIAPPKAEDFGFSEERVTVAQPCTWKTVPPEDPDTPFFEHDAPFLVSKPKLFEEGGAADGGAGGGEGGSVRELSVRRLQVWPQSSLALRAASAVPSTPGAPMKLRCKLKSGHAVAAALAAGIGISPGGPAGEVAGDSGSATAAPRQPATGSRKVWGKPRTMEPDFRKALEEERERLDPFMAARINEHIVRSVLSRLPQHVQDMYACSPRRLAFGPDMHELMAPKWAALELSFVDLLSDKQELSGSAEWQPGPGEGRVVLRSPRSGSLIGDTRFNGMLYCTVISEAQAFEYIMYESQKGEGVEVDTEGVLVAKPAAVNATSA